MPKNYLLIYSEQLATEIELLCRFLSLFLGLWLCAFLCTTVVVFDA